MIQQEFSQDKPERAQLIDALKGSYQAPTASTTVIGLANQLAILMLSEEIGLDSDPETDIEPLADVIQAIIPKIEDRQKVRKAIRSWANRPDIPTTIGNLEKINVFPGSMEEASELGIGFLYRPDSKKRARHFEVRKVFGELTDDVVHVSPGEAIAEQITPTAKIMLDIIAKSPVADMGDLEYRVEHRVFGVGKLALIPSKTRPEAKPFQRLSLVWHALTRRYLTDGAREELISLGRNRLIRTTGINTSRDAWDQRGKEE